MIADLLDRISSQDPTLNAFACIDAEGAMRAAKLAEARVMSGEALGPLHGVPVTVKDLIWTRSLKTEFGSRLKQGFQPECDAPSVERLEAAGAILIGKTTTSEFGWIGKGRSPLTGITRNPWAPEFDAGGSSAGAAAAAAAGFGPLHLATDGAGSIRIPAHFCGVFGFKPTYGLVPQFPVSTNDYTSHAGPITRNVRDAVLMLEVMAGPHALDHTSVERCRPIALDLAAAGLQGERIAYSADLGHARVDPCVAQVVGAAVRQLARSAEVAIEDVAPSWGRDGAAIIRALWPAHLGRFAAERSRRDEMDPGLVACAEDGADVTLRAYQELRERKYAYCGEIGSFFDDWDILLTPTASVAAFAADRVQPDGWPEHPWDWLGWAEFLYPFNLAGNPAASVPCGFTAEGLPVGLQVVGRRFDDAGVLGLSAVAERIFGLDLRPPVVV